MFCGDWVTGESNSRELTSDNLAYMHWNKISYSAYNGLSCYSLREYVGDYCRHHTDQEGEQWKKKLYLCVIWSLHYMGFPLKNVDRKWISVYGLLWHIWRDICGRQYQKQISIASINVYIPQHYSLLTPYQIDSILFIHALNSCFGTNTLYLKYGSVSTS